jgi:hypothetical protein
LPGYFDSRIMGSIDIKSGKAWIVNLGEAQVRVEVIAAHGEFPDTWICRRIDDAGQADTGMHILLHERAFVERAGAAEASDERDGA